MNPISVNRLTPDWPAPDGVDACFTLRTGGHSAPPWDSLNLAHHVGDSFSDVARNRASLGFVSEPFWLRQVHSSRCITRFGEAEPEADAAVTGESGRVLAVMVADCLPVLLCTGSGSRVGVAHAGWRGLAGDVLRNSVRAMGDEPVFAWLGPAIGPCHYEVGDDVRTRFAGETGFEVNARGRYQMDLYAIAREQLQGLGVKCFGGDFCTFCDEARFFSYRRDGVTGRMAGLIRKSA